jgi:hypothetical protein
MLNERRVLSSETPISTNNSNKTHKHRIYLRKPKAYLHTEILEFLFQVQVRSIMPPFLFLLFPFPFLWISIHGTEYHRRGVLLQPLISLCLLPIFPLFVPVYIYDTPHLPSHLWLTFTLFPWPLSSMTCHHVLPRWHFLSRIYDSPPLFPLITRSTLYGLFVYCFISNLIM